MALPNLGAAAASVPLGIGKAGADALGGALKTALQPLDPRNLGKAVATAPIFGEIGSGIKDMYGSLSEQKASNDAIKENTKETKTSVGGLVKIAQEQLGVLQDMLQLQKDQMTLAARDRVAREEARREANRIQEGAAAGTDAVKLAEDDSVGIADVAIGNTISRVIDKVLASIVAALAVFKTSIISFFKVGLPKLLGGVFKVINPIAIAGVIISAFTGFFTDAINSERSNIFLKILDGLTGGIGQIVEFLSFGFIKKEDVTGMFKPLIDWIENFDITSIFDGLTLDFDGFVEGLSRLGKWLKGLLKDFLGTMGLDDDFAEALGKGVENVKKNLKKAADFFMGIGDYIGNKFDQMMTSLQEGFEGVLLFVAEKLKKIPIVGEDISNEITAYVDEQQSGREAVKKAQEDAKKAAEEEAKAKAAEAKAKKDAAVKAKAEADAAKAVAPMPAAVPAQAKAAAAPVKVEKASTGGGGGDDGYQAWLGTLPKMRIDKYGLLTGVGFIDPVTGQRTKNYRPISASSLNTAGNMDWVNKFLASQGLSMDPQSGIIRLKGSAEAGIATDYQGAIQTEQNRKVQAQAMLEKGEYRGKALSDDQKAILETRIKKSDEATAKLEARQKEAEQKRAEMMQSGAIGREIVVGGSDNSTTVTNTTVQTKPQATADGQRMPAQGGFYGD